MLKKLIWPSEATPSQAPSEQLTLPIPENVAIVITPRVGDAMTAMASEDIAAIHAQLLCIALLESAPQLASADQAQRDVRQRRYAGFCWCQWRATGQR